MNQNPPITPNSAANPRRSPFLPVIIAFVIGAVVAGAWVQRQHAGSTSTELSPATKNLLAGLPASVTIHYYSLLPAGTDEALPAFSKRVQQLLDAVQSASDGKVTVTSTETPSDASANAASADGIQAFNLDKGDACFLGLSAGSGTHKQVLPRLDPRWESALQFDIARAILAVTAAQSPERPAPNNPKPGPEIVSSVKRLIPDASTVTPEQADQIFHAEFVRECGEVGAQVEREIAAAQQKVVQAQAGGSEEAIAAARKNLQQVQFEAGEKMKQIAADLQARLAVFQQMKTAGPAK